MKAKPKIALNKSMPDAVVGVAIPAILADYITPEQLAAELGVSIRSIHRWHALRQGPPRTHVGRRPMYRRGAVESWLARRERDSETETKRRRRA